MYGRITEYNCQGCLVKLVFDRGAYWAEVRNGDTWAYTVGPRSCPQEALCCGELEVFKAQIKKMIQPALIFAMRRKEPGQEIILAQNLDAVELLQIEATGLMMSEFVEQGQLECYYKLMKNLRKGINVEQELVLQSAVGNKISVYLKAYPIKSEISITALAYSYFLV